MLSCFPGLLKSHGPSSSASLVKGGMRAQREEGTHNIWLALSSFDVYLSLSLSLFFTLACFHWLESNNDVTIYVAT